MWSKRALKIYLLAAIACLAIAFYWLGFHELLTFEYIKGQRDHLIAMYSANQTFYLVSFTLAYIVLAGTSFPGATLLTLAGGAVFGFWFGMLTVCIGSTVGATVAFWIARFLFRDFFEARFSDQLEIVDKGMEKEGWFYLLTLRLVPLFPFFAVNILMGLTKISTRKYFLVSAFGMLPGTAVYVAAGVKISSLESASGLLDPTTIALLVLLTFLSRISKAVVDFIKTRYLG